MSIESTRFDGQRLPLNPSRDNYGRSCDHAPADSTTHLPSHVTPCACDTHDGVCNHCHFKITVGPNGTEYGHARATNRKPDPDGVRRDCPKRPTECNPGDRHVWTTTDSETTSETDSETESKSQADSESETEAETDSETASVGDGDE